MLLGVPISELAFLSVAIIGAAAVTGVLSGLLGIGGAAITVPVLFEFFGIMGVPDSVRMQLCVGTSLAVIVPVSLRSYFAHKAKSAVRDDVLKLWIVPIVLGTIGGAIIAYFAPSSLFKLVFVVIGGGIALKLLFVGDKWTIGSELPGKAVTAVYGLFIGLASSLMGIAGGSLGTLYLTLFGVPIHTSIATSSGIGILIALPGAIGYMIAGWPQMNLLPPLSVGFVSLIGLLLFAPVSVLMTPFGAKLAHNMPKRKLEIAFAIFLLTAALRFLASLLGLF
jgi:uncharacterized membrane protein YfcA